MNGVAIIGSQHSRPEAGPYPLGKWRLIYSPAADGPTNMAVDEAILHAVGTRHSPPTLRLYGWEPPCLSVGRGQPTQDVDRRALEEAGYGLVRRPTGGRALLHIDELTYSIAVPEDDPRVGGGVVESYRRLSAGLVRGLVRLGVADIVADERAENRGVEGAVCFEVPSDYEITVGGKKLVGRAQMRAQGVVVQHGAIPLAGDIARICPFLIGLPDAARVRARATTVERALRRRVSWEEAADALAGGVAEALNLKLDLDQLTADESAAARELRARKYTTEAWTTIA